MLFSPWIYGAKTLEIQRTLSTEKSIAYFNLLRKIIENIYLIQVSVPQHNRYL